MRPINYIHVIGCGGVGSYLIPVLLKSFHIGALHLWDGDTLEHRNLDRQLFGAAHIGLNKAEALAQIYEGHDTVVTTHPRYFTPGCSDFRVGSILLGCVDNHPARKAVLLACDMNQCPGTLGMNEYEESQALVYLPKWKSTPLDPRVRYPVIEADQSDDPTRPLGCTGESQVAHPQLALANSIAAQMMLSHLWWLTQVRPGLDDDVAQQFTPVEHLWAAGRFSTRLSKDLNQ